MTYRTKLVVAVLERLAGGDQTVAAEMLGVTQTSISRYLSGQRVVRPSVALLAEQLLISHRAHRGIVPAARVLELAKSVRKARGR